MKKQNKILVCLLLMTVLLMGVGYAALSNVTLTITGTASAAANQDNFKVYFTGNVTESNETNVDASATANAITASVDFSGMDTIGQTQHAIFEIENGSEGINASDIQVTLHDTDTNYFDIFAEMCDSTGNTVIPAGTKNPVPAKAKTYVKVSASLKANPVADTTTQITVKITAEPDTTVQAN